MAINDMVEIRADVIRTTTYAYLVDDGSVREWLPAELMEHIAEIGGDTIEFDIPLWLARDKGFV